MTQATNNKNEVTVQEAVDGAVKLSTVLNKNCPKIIANVEDIAGKDFDITLSGYGSVRNDIATAIGESAAAVNDVGQALVKAYDNIENPQVANSMATPVCSAYVGK